MSPEASDHLSFPAVSEAALAYGVPGGADPARPFLAGTANGADSDGIEPRPRGRAVAFTSQATACLRACAANYATELEFEALFVARETDNDEVQAVNVRKAELRLRSEPAVSRDLALAFGSLVCGGGISLLTTEVTAEHWSPGLGLAAVLIVALSACLVAWAIVARPAR